MLEKAKTKLSKVQTEHLNSWFSAVGSYKNFKFSHILNDQNILVLITILVEQR
jgi:hypothetical protein